MTRKTKKKDIENEEEIEPDEVNEYEDQLELIDIDDDEVWNRDSLRVKYQVDIVRTPNNEQTEFEIQDYIGIKRIQYDTQNRTHLAHLWLVILYKARGVFKKMPFIALIRIDYRNWHPMILDCRPEEIPPKTRVRLTADGEVITKVEIISNSESGSVS